MTREEIVQTRAYQRNKAACDYVYSYAPPSMIETFEEGAAWADETMLKKLKEFVDHHTDIKDVYNFINIMQK